MTQQFDNLAATVFGNTSISESVVNLVNGVAVQVRAAGQEIIALADALVAENGRLAAAVAANAPQSANDAASAAKTAQSFQQPIPVLDGRAIDPATGLPPVDPLKPVDQNQKSAIDPATGKPPVDSMGRPIVGAAPAKQT